MAQAANPYGAPKAAVAEVAATQPVRVFSISGRIGRARYIAYGMGFNLLIILTGGILIALVGQNAVVVAIAWIAALVITLVLAIQRSHDFNTSGWLSLLALIPVVNLIFWFIPGSAGPNRFGAPTPRNGAGVIIAVCVAPLVFLSGIVAAIAIPAYQDYTLRARVAELLASATPWRTAIGEHYAAHQKLPSSAAELANGGLVLGNQTSHGGISVGTEGVLTLTLSGQSRVAGRTIVLRPRAAGGVVQWDCTGGTLEPKFRPASCRARQPG